LIARRTRKRHRSFIQAADAKAARFFPDPRAPEGRINLGAFACGDTITLIVRFGSKADIEASSQDVRFALKSGHAERDCHVCVVP
jgi:hypothetical protein